MNASSPHGLLMGGQNKITAEHLQLLAYVYVRQSTAKQVLHNRESQANQYSLAQRAEALGWNPQRVRVIDADLGVSGQHSDNRDGFKELVAEVSLGHVGIVFGYEVSRLARNNSDWYQLLDLAAVFGTLIADADGIYDPRLYNDRLLLGLKGTMSEAELHLLRQRLVAGRMSQVRRGAYRQHLPTGLVRLPDGTVVQDPDDQVRHVTELVLAKFEELGSCPKVLRYLRQENILLPRHQTSGFHAGELLWKQPSDSAIYEMIRNPAYAGAFAYGRRQQVANRRRPGRMRQAYRPIEEWTHLQMDVYPAYISWEQFLANQERLRQNAMCFDELVRGAQGAARQGSALLQGLAICGYCGCRMSVHYKHSTHSYFCNALFKRFGEPACATLSGPAIDAVVVQAFFAAIQPAQLDALEAVLSTQQAERERLDQQWTEQLKRARYEAYLAERQFSAVDPANRLVAAELERRWEEKLHQLQSTQEAYDRFQQTPVAPALAPELREQFQRISDTLPQLWQGPQLSNAQKKDLLRSLISRVILKRVAADQAEVKIVWASGHYSTVYARMPVNRQTEVADYEKMIERIGTLWRQGLDDEQIVAQLEAEDFHTARSMGVSPVTVQKIRLERDWHLSLHRSRNALELDGYWTARGLAAELGVERTWVYNRIYSGKIDPSYVARDPQSEVYLIRQDPALLEQLRQLLPEKLRAKGGI